MKEISMKNSKNIKDFNIYLGALIYPKEFLAIASKKHDKRLIEESFDTLYKFSLSKMKTYLMKDSIHNLFMNYYEAEIKNGQRIESNKTMKKHKDLYLEAFRILLNFLTKNKKDKSAPHSMLG